MSLKCVDLKRTVLYLWKSVVLKRTVLLSLKCCPEKVTLWFLRKFVPKMCLQSIVADDADCWLKWCVSWRTVGCLQRWVSCLRLGQILHYFLSHLSSVLLFSRFLGLLYAESVLKLMYLKGEVSSFFKNVQVATGYNTTIHSVFIDSLFFTLSFVIFCRSS